MSSESPRSVYSGRGDFAFMNCFKILSRGEGLRIGSIEILAILKI